ncbi:uncharacterized protein [Antedon mediterranea]|uniref:uncharacterized protein n=1 Tax=Antedon mediterranea TaxID=105859 RepID=UPI003AF61191
MFECIDCQQPVRENEEGLLCDTCDRWQMMFRQQIRTNNDVEGYHQRLNQRAKKSNLHFYLLCKLLLDEGQTVAIHAELVGREDNLRNQSRHAARATVRLNLLWDEYSRGTRTARALLLAASRVISRN